MKKKKKALIIFILVLLFLVCTSLPVSGLRAYDVKNYNISIKLLPEDGKIEGKAILYIESNLMKNRTENKLELFLQKSLNIENIYIIPEKSGRRKYIPFFDRNESSVIIYPEQDNEQDKPQHRNFSVEIEYSGALEYNTDAGEWAYIGDDSAYAIYEAKWYPQHIGDRATGIIEIEVPENWVAISNGEAMSNENHFIFVDNFPEVGFSFAAAEYKHIIKTQNAHMQIECYLITPLRDCDRMLIDILGFMESKLTPYPYPKLALAEVKDNLKGAHGDQGLVILSDKISRNEPLLSQFLAHEVAHNWFGDVITVKKFREKKDLWIIEGIANYMSIAYLESRNSKAAGKFLEEAREEYLRMREHEDVAIKDVEGDYGALFHAIAYAKGTWVLRMLNYVVGDDKFYSMLRELINEHAWNSTSIDDFEKIANKVYGKDLSWFFDAWVHKTLLPDYAISDAEVERKGSTYLLRLRIEQKGDIIKMPLEIYIKTDKSEVVERIMMEGREKEAEFELQEKPIFVEIDRHAYILEKNRKNNKRIVGFDFSYSFIKILLHSLEEDMKEFLMI